MAAKKSKIKEGIKGVKFTTPKFRLSFPKLFTPEAYDKNQKPAYSLNMLFPKTQDLKEMKLKVLEAAKEAFGPDKKKWPSNLKLPWRDGDSNSDYEGYEGSIYCMAKSYNKPVVIDRNKERIEIEGDIYAGCYARAVVVAKATEAGGNYFITLYLQGVQKIADGEPFGSGVNIDEDFDDLEDDESNDFETDSDDDLGF